MKKYQMAIVGLVLILSFPFMLKHIPGEERKPLADKQGIIGKIVFEDKNSRLIARSNRLIYMDKGVKAPSSLELPPGDIMFLRRMDNKPALEPPLAGTPIKSGIMVSSKSDIHIIQLEPEFRIISSYPDPKGAEDKIIVNKTKNVLYLYQMGELYKSYCVATGLKKEYTPEGIFKIANKIKYPRGTGSDSQFGVCWLGLSVPPERDKRTLKHDERAPLGNKYGIHGTNEPDSIGTMASGGCIRMHNADVNEVFNMVQIGTTVEIRP